MASKKPSRRSADDEPPGYQTAYPKTSLAKYVPDEDSEDNRPSKTSRSRTQKPQPSSSRRAHDSDDEGEPPAEDRRGGKQKATTRTSRRDDRRERYDDGDNDRYGGSRRDNGNRARYQSESRSRSRSRNRTNATAMVKRGESSRAVTKRDTRSRADAKGTGSSRARRGQSDDEEDVIKISRYVTVDFREVSPDVVEELCELLDVRANKIKQWCDRDLIRQDNTTGLLDLKALVKEVDEDDARKLRRFIEKLKNEKEAAMISGAQNRHGRHDHHHHHHPSSPFVEGYPTSRSRQATISLHPYTDNPIVDDCEDCWRRGASCSRHFDIVEQSLW